MCIMWNCEIDQINIIVQLWIVGVFYKWYNESNGVIFYKAYEVWEYDLYACMLNII